MLKRENERGRKRNENLIIATNVQISEKGYRTGRPCTYYVNPILHTNIPYIFLLSIKLFFLESR
jgi:hypothetical protein